MEPFTAEGKTAARCPAARADETVPALPVCRGGRADAGEVPAARP